MKAALGQLQIHWEDKEANLKKAEAYLELLSEKKTDLFLLPEMSLTGFSMHTERIKEKREETVERMQRLAEKYQVAIGAGWVKDAGALCENHYSIVAPEGRILDYTKLHPFRFGGEAEHFQGGNALPVCGFGGFCVGVQICYDLRKARAIENMVYVAGINCAGEMGKLFYSGDSRLYAPDGTKLKKETARLPGCGTGERVMIYDLQNDVHSYRECFPVKEDRRERLYQKLQEETWDYERKE